MKKLLLSAALLLALSVSFTSCKDVKEKTDAAGDAVENAAAETTEAVEEAAEAVTETVTGVPSFDNAEVQSYVTAYEDYIETYTEAVTTKDMTKMQALATKGQELATKGQEAMKNVKAEDMKKLTDYMTSKSTEVMELAKKMTAQ
ncbi:MULTISPECIES: hypothetical protein [unclassified Lacinutrix]